MNSFILFPITGAGRVVGPIADLVFSLILLAGLHSMARRKFVRDFLSVFVIPAVITHYAWILLGLPSLAGWNFLF